MRKDNKTTKSKTKISITDEYFSYHEKYIGKYGTNTIVLLEVGSFYEMYSNPNTLKGPDLYKLSDILNLVVTRKDKSIPLSDTNVLMSGLPNHAISKFLKLLVDNNYTVVIFNQHKSTDGTITRSLDGIYSPSTFIDNPTVENKFLMTLYFELNGALNSSKPNISIGMSAIDTSTGQVIWYETHGSGILNESDAWNEAQRFYHFYRPVELITYQINNTIIESKINIDEKIDILPNQSTLKYSKINPEFTKISYQNKLLKKVYPNCGMETPIEYCGLDKYPYAIIALTNSFDYVYQHNEKLLYELKIPQYFDEHKYMILGNNAQYQLNVIDYYNWDKIDSKFHSLNAVINNCATSMGKRILKERLCAPLTDPIIIQSCYDLTERIIKLNIWEEIRLLLKGISDLDKLFRKLSIKFISPYELYSIYNSFGNIVKIIELISKTDLKNELYKMFSKHQIGLFVKAINFIEEKFNIEGLKDVNWSDIKSSFYIKGVYPDIDLIVNKIDSGVGLIDELGIELSKMCGNSNSDDIKFGVKHNDRDGYYINTTKIRGEKLQSCLKMYLAEKSKNNIKTIKLSNTDIEIDDIVFTYQKSTCKITYNGLTEHSDEIELLYEELDTKIKQYFLTDVSMWYFNNIEIFKDLINMIVQFDVVTNNAYTSLKYNYVKPILSTNTEKNKNLDSFIHAKNLRHPIIERIIDYEYVPHDVKLDSEIKGNLIYGYNGAGKSSIMKGIGLNLIMAQCGMYVSADSFEYAIFDSMYTRISGGDNLFKGHSSFIIEMNELSTILKKSTSKSLVIGDEICRGTEYLSANSIVASAIIKLANIGTKFLFATHLHELVNIEEVKELNTIKFYHLSVEERINTDELIFDRKLLEGTGEQIYGIKVAKYILNDSEFINKAVQLKNSMLEKNGTNTKLVSDKKSIYNKEIYVDECAICKSTNKLETHHINWQKDFVNGVHSNKKHIVKDSKQNLVVLCSTCHDCLHDKKFNIDGLIKTSGGIKIIEK